MRTGGTATAIPHLRGGPTGRAETRIRRHRSAGLICLERQGDPPTPHFTPSHGGPFALAESNNRHAPRRPSIRRHALTNERRDRRAAGNIQERLVAGRSLLRLCGFVHGLCLSLGRPAAAQQLAGHRDAGLGLRLPMSACLLSTPPQPGHCVARNEVLNKERRGWTQNPFGASFAKKSPRSRLSSSARPRGKRGRKPASTGCGVKCSTSRPT